MTPVSPAGWYASRMTLSGPAAMVLACFAQAACLAQPAATPLPVVRLTADDTRISSSCIIEIAPGTVIPDPNADGVLHVVADHAVIVFAPGSALRGAPPETPWDTLTGIGIRVEGRSGVRIESAHVHGFKVGLLASGANSLQVSGGDFSDNFRQRLRSTPVAEDASDWLFPHNNDSRKWRDQYGAALCIEDSSGVSVSGIRVRRGQNGIILDRVNDSRIFDNDCSFLSGWGLAMWRSSGNTVSRNQFDFCVRGHSEGIYNRGQDSAGILFFEQNNRNVIVENSATHGGDGFFAFAGKEAIGETWWERERDRLRRETGRDDVDPLIRVPDDLAADLSSRGCNDNLIIANDFSYAAAHGLELTFSEHNVIALNRLVENAICGMWGGYSSGNAIVANLFARNGGMAYGLERGGINIEHGSDNTIAHNRFLDNRCAIHLWWNDNPGLARLPGVRGNARGVTGNVIAANAFVSADSSHFRNLRDSERLPVLHLRDPGKGNVRDNAFVGNTLDLRDPRAVELDATPGAEPRRDGDIPALSIPEYAAFGERRAVGARTSLRGRDQIIMDEWGPWDHASPMLRARSRAGSTHVYELYGAPGVRFHKGEKDGMGMVYRQQGPAQVIELRATPGVHPYRIPLEAGGLTFQLSGTIVAAEWDVCFFPWDAAADPRENLDAWRRLADSPAAVHTRLASLSLPFANGGPGNLPSLKDLRAKLPWRDRFGTIARATIPLPPGRWRFSTLSDDGIRVTVNGRPAIENWTWHGPTRDSGIFEQQQEGDAEIIVEHFEIDGYATLELDIERAGE